MIFISEIIFRYLAVWSDILGIQYGKLGRYF